MTAKRFVINSIVLSLIIISLLALLIIIVDPYFHYHKPLSNLSYTLNNQRYQNDGIIKHFDYDAIITGTSMTENFKTSEFDTLFNVKSIKASFSGGSFKEINDNIATAIKYNNKIKIVLRSIDLYKINKDKDFMSYDNEIYPTYLYDNNIFNDIKYVLNKDIIIEAIKYINNSINKQPSTSFDDYSSWYQFVNFSKETVDSMYNRLLKKEQEQNITSLDYERINGNIQQNIIDLATKYPEIDFYLFYPPYSIYYWDNLSQSGKLNLELETINYTTQLLVKYKNIHLYSFLDEYSIITNLNIYKDIEHYNEKINSLMLEKMKNNENLITEQNYKEKMSKLKEYFTNYNYDKLFTE